MMAKSIRWIIMNRHAAHNDQSKLNRATQWKVPNVFVDEWNIILFVRNEVQRQWRRKIGDAKTVILHVSEFIPLNLSSKPFINYNLVNRFTARLTEVDALNSKHEVFMCFCEFDVFPRFEESEWFTCHHNQWFDGISTRITRAIRMKRKRKILYINCWYHQEWSVIRLD